MKRLITLLSLMILLAQFTFGQLSGTKNIPGDYADLATAITDLNTQGVGAGGVTLNLLASNPQTAPAGGYIIGGTGSLVLTTTSASNQVIIQGNGNVITAPTPQTSGNLNDAIFKLIGADYITITAFTMYENASNTTTTAGSNNMTEWGVALLYVTTTDGSSNNTISSCTIDLDRTYQNTFGIYSNSTHSATSITTSATATGAAGGNHNLTVTGNTIQDVNIGIVVVGPTAAADMNEGLTIGGSLPNANTITNYGTTGTFSGYANVSGTVNGILARNTRNFTISYNTVTSSNGGVTAGTLNGIQVPSYSNTPTGTFSMTINYNTISLRSGLASGAMNGINCPSGSASATSTININNNDFQTWGHSVSGTGAITFILLASTHQFTNINNNTFTNISVNTTGNVTFISHNFAIPSTGQCIINNNSIVTAFNKTGAGGTVYFTNTNSLSGTGSINNYTNNSFTNVTLTGATALNIFQNTDGGTGSTKTITNNTINSITGGTSAIIGFNFTYWNGVSSLANNTVTNVTGQAAITGILLGSAANNATSIAVNSNIINNLSSTGTGGTVIGISCSNTSPGINIYSNMINTLSTTNSSGVVSGISIGGASTTGIYKNKIYNLSGNQTGTTINGINITSGTTLNINNNLIGDLNATAATGLNAINGINASASSTYNIYYNTIYLNATSSSASTFGTSCLTFGTTGTLNLRNNILVNLSTPAQEGLNIATNGISACLRRSSGTTGTVPSNYSTTSNNNDFWCNPTAGTNNHMSYVEGTGTITNPCNTVTALQTFMVNRDQVSFAENPPFISTTGANSTYLHISTSIPTLCESGAATIAAVTDDYDGDTRSATPDVGADEFNGIPAGVVNPGNFTATVASTQQINLGFTTNPNNDDVVIVWNATGTFTTPSGTPPAPGGSLAGGTVLYQGKISPVNHTGLTYNTAYYYKAFSYNGSSYSSGVTSNATTVIAAPTAFTATAASSSQINLAYTKNASNSDVFITTNSTSTFDQPANGTTYTVGTTVGANGVVIYQGPLSAFNHTSLTPATTYYYKIWSVDAFSFYSTTGATANATTFCNPVSTFPYSENFNSVTVPALPSCFSQNNANGDGDYWITYITYGVGGTNCAGLYTDFNTGANNDYLILPQFTLNGNQRLKFSVRARSASEPNDYRVVLSTTDNLPASFTTVLMPLTTVTTITMTEITPISLASYTGNVWIAIQVPAGGLDGYYLYVDDIIVEDIPSCLTPTALTATSITNNSANLSWTPGGTETAWEYSYGVSPYPTPSGSGTATSSSTTNPISGLTSNTAYQYYVRANCGGSGFSTWAGPYSFTTACDPETAPTAVQDFSTYTGYAPPPICWAEATGNLAASSTLTYTNSEWNVATGFANTGSNTAVKVNLYGSGNSWFISNPIDLGVTPGLYRVKFDMAVTSYNGTAAQSTLGTHRVDIVVSTDGGNTWSNANIIKTYTGAGSYSNTGQIEVINLTGYSGVVKIAFVETTTDTSPDIDFHIDNFQVEAIPTCPAPTSLTANSITNNSANLAWTPGGTETAWEYSYGTSPYPTPAGSGTITSSNTTNPISGLSSNTAYQFYVRANCGGSGYSTWAGPYSFTTLCDPYTSINENFDAVTPPALPGCWTKYISPSYSSETVITYATGPYSSPNCVQLYDSYAYLLADAPMLITPYISNLNAGTHQLRFFAKGNSSNLSVIVGTMTDPANPATFTTIQTVTGLSTSAYTECVVSFASYSGSDHYIAFKHPLTSSYAYLYLDDIHWEPLPTCPRPSSLSSAVTSGTTAELNWTNGGSETAWQVAYGSVGFNPLTGGTRTGVIAAHPYTLGSLSAGTSYDWYVRAICSPGDTSAWSPVGSFTTAFSNPTPCALALAIPDNGCGNSSTTRIVSLQVSGLTGTQLGTNVVLSSVSLIITHPFDGDVDIYLVSPNNVSVELSTDNGVGGDNYGNSANCPTDVTTFTMTASTSITLGTPPYIGSYLPEGNLNNFNDGSNPNGVWRLEVCDDAGTDVGTVQYVALSFVGLSTWTGNVSTAWGDAGNWDPASIPGSITPVLIPTNPQSDPDRFPDITGTVTCYALDVAAGATANILPGATFNVINLILPSTGTLNNQGTLVIKKP
jgi:subtilisin-like proprotein convertase family protein